MQCESMITNDQHSSGMVSAYSGRGRDKNLSSGVASSATVTGRTRGQLDMVRVRGWSTLLPSIVSLSGIVLHVVHDMCYAYMAFDCSPTDPQP